MGCFKIDENRLNQKIRIFDKCFLNHELKGMKDFVIINLENNSSTYEFNIFHELEAWELGYWKIGTDMILENRGLGIGSYNSTEEFEKYIVKQPLEYQKKYYKYHEGTPFENSYINIAIENGLLYLIYFITIQIIILKKIF